MSAVNSWPNLLERMVSVTFDDGFSMIKGDAYWIGSDSCEYDDPFDYLKNGSPVKQTQNVVVETLPYLEAHEVCGYCMREPGTKHAPSCRQ